MAHTNKAPKQWALMKHETATSFHYWCQNFQYTLTTDDRFTQFLVADHSWRRRSAADPNCGYANIENGLTGVEQAINLDLMLGQIANFCPVISRNTIVKNCKTLNKIWDKIRLNSLWIQSHRRSLHRFPGY